MGLGELYGSGGGSMGLGGSLWDIVGLGVSVTPPLCLSPPQFCWEDPELETTMEFVLSIVRALRGLRAEHGLTRSRPPCEGGAGGS